VGELDLITEAFDLAQSQLMNRSIYHGLDWEIGMSIASTFLSYPSITVMWAVPPIPAVGDKDAEVSRRIQ
jgi:hypothetical protein